MSGKEGGDARIVVKMLGNVPEVDLPDGWIGLAHQTGGIIYMHKDTRVVTWSRPYQISHNASLRKHNPPLISIPCLHQLMVKNNELKLHLRKKENEDMNCEPIAKKKKLDEGSSSKTGERVSDKNSLCDFDTVDYPVLHNYISKIFEFKKDSSWKLPLFSDHQFKTAQTLPSKNKTSFVTENKTPLQIIYEYSQKLIRESVTFKKLNIELLVDVCVETMIGDRKYAIATGDTSKKARQLAAALTLHIFEPDLSLDGYKDIGNQYPEKFDKIEIEDVNVVKLIKEENSLKKPFEVLLKLMQRNFDDFLENDLEYYTDQNLVRMKYKNIEVSVTVGNETLDRQIAAQAMIKKLYPNLKYWGSIIRLSNQKMPSVKKEENTSSKKPQNKFMLALKDEMRKIGDL